MIPDYMWTKTQCFTLGGAYSKPWAHGFFSFRDRQIWQWYYKTASYDFQTVDTMVGTQ